MVIHDESATKDDFLMFSKAKAVIIVSDSKSGYSSIQQQHPGITSELESLKYLKGSKPMIIDAGRAQNPVRSRNMATNS